MFLQLGREHLQTQHAEATLGNTSCQFVAVLFDGPSGYSCSLDGVAAAAQAAQGQPQPAIYDVDHEYPGGDSQAPTAVLYADLDAAAFSQWHKTMLELHEAGKLRYVFRHRRDPQLPPSPPIRLGGYGVELAVKKTEYIFTDDSAVHEDADLGLTEPGAEDESANDVAGFNFAR